MGKSKKKKTSPQAQRRADRKRKERKDRRKELRVRSQTHPDLDPGPRPSTEVSPIHDMTADDYVARLVADRAPTLPVLRRIRNEKARGTRPRPSSRMIGDATLPTLELQARLLDKIAELVDENVFGRSEMCLQFAALLAKALTSLGITAAAKRGNARYRKPNGEWFGWNHAWIEYDNCVVDGNVDSMCENPLVDQGVDPSPFWGHRNGIPEDRQYDFASSTSWSGDEDSETWWLRLHDWLKVEILNAARDGPSPSAP